MFLVPGQLVLVPGRTRLAREAGSCLNLCLKFSLAGAQVEGAPGSFPKGLQSQAKAP